MSSSWTPFEGGNKLNFNELPLSYFQNPHINPHILWKVIDIYPLTSHNMGIFFRDVKKRGCLSQ